MNWEPNRSDLLELDAATLAIALLGVTVLSESGAHTTAGIVAETEAYLGVHDAACHAYARKNTPRLRSLWSGPGLAYVYTVHRQWLLNLTVRQSGVPHCVLIRSLIPIRGLELMSERRKLSLAPHDATDSELKRLTAGPGRLCSALGINKRHDGTDMLNPESELRLERTADQLLKQHGIQKGTKIVAGARVGVAYAGEAARWPLRFWFEHSPFLSRPSAKLAGSSHLLKNSCLR